MSVYTDAKLIVTPNAYKDGKLYALKGVDLDVVRATSATRVNSAGLIESVGNNIPRLDYTNASCPSILVEPQRTNIALWSDMFANVTWNKVNSSVTVNTTISPSGVQDADTITTISVGNVLSQTITVTASTAYTFSFYALRGSMTDLKYSVYNLSGASEIIAPTSYYSQTSASSWVRVSATFTTPVGCTSINIYPIRNTGVTGTVFLWGAQLEVGSYATSYIPTVASAVTRAADNISRSNIYTNGLITSAGGTWYVELNNNFSLIGDIGGDYIILSTTNSTAGSGFRLYSGPTNLRTVLYKFISGGGTNLFTTTTDTVKIAFKWNGTTADIFVNGVKQVSATAFTTTNMEFLTTNITAVPKYIKSTYLFPTPLTDLECTQLTTL